MQNYDYSQNGCYFVTICTHDKQCRFGRVVNNQMCLNELGLMVEQEWLHLPERFSDIQVVPFIVMPNHIHGVITLNQSGGADEGRGAGVPRRAPTLSQQAQMGNTGLFNIIKTFKSITTITANRLSGSEGEKLWQRGYYEHIIRSEEELYELSVYIENNTAKWNGEVLLTPIQSEPRRNESSCFPEQ